MVPQRKRAEFVRGILGAISVSVICFLHGCEVEVGESEPSIERPPSKGVPGVEIQAFEPRKGNGCAVVIFPGGGYSYVAMDYEGKDPANWLKLRGYTAFLVKYKLGRAPAPMNDGRRAVRWVRHNAARYGLDVERIGVWGFSAGGHLASTVCTNFGIAGQLGDEVDKESARPSFCILWYPVISMQDSLTHKGSRNNLLGHNPSAEQKRQFSNEMQVTPNTPPSFLVHARDDNLVSVQNSIVFNDALKAKGVKSEMHLSDTGGHGHGLRTGTYQLDTWLAQFKASTAGNAETVASAAQMVEQNHTTASASIPVLGSAPGA